MASLVVNLDAVALLRQARRSDEPDPAATAVVAEMAGADALSLHLRGDRRHVQERDVMLARELAHARLLLSIAPTQAMIKFAYSAKPHGVTLVPERRDEPATEGGLDLILDEVHLRKMVRALRDAGVDVAVLIEPDLDQVKATRSLGAQVVAFNTRAYADSKRDKEASDELERLDGAARIAKKYGMRVRAAHGLNLRNVGSVASLDAIDEIEVGLGLFSRAILIGLDSAVRELKAIVA